MPRHDVKRLDRAVESLQLNLKQVIEFEEIIPIWRRPGWTTPAEFILVEGMLESMVGLSKQLLDMKQVVMNGSQEIAPDRAAAD